MGKQVTKLTTPRRIYIDRLDLGDGEIVKGWLVLSESGIEVRKYYSSVARWFVPLRDAAEAIARRSQVRRSNAILGTGGGDGTVGEEG